MKFPSPLALFPACLALVGAALLPMAQGQETVPALYNYQPARVYYVTYDIPLPEGEQWKKIAAQEWFREGQPLRLEFSLIGIDFRSEKVPKFLSPGLLLGGKGTSPSSDEDEEEVNGWTGMTKNFVIGFDPEQSSVRPKDGFERRPARLRAGGAKTSSGVIGMKSLTREGEYDWYLPMQTNEISVIQYAAVMQPGEPLPSMNPEMLLRPQTNISRRDAEDFIERLNELGLLPQDEGKVSWNIRHGSEAKPKAMDIALGRRFSFALPTQTEWEFAARGGDLNKEQYEQDYPLAVFPDMKMAFKYEHCMGTGREGGRSLVSTTYIEKRNCLGLLNMLGNAMEWVEDDRLPHGAGHQGDPTLREPEGAVSPASRGADMGNKQGDESVGFRLVIRSHIYSQVMGNPYGLNKLSLVEEAKAEVALASYLAKAGGSNASNKLTSIQVDTTPPAPITLSPEQMSRHRIAAGDTWDAIARQHDMSVDELRKLNPYASRIDHLFPDTYVDVRLKPGEVAAAATMQGNLNKNSGSIEEQLRKAAEYIADHYGDNMTEIDCRRSHSDEECKRIVTLLRANLQNAQANYLLGYCYERGIGVGIDATKAFQSYSFAAKHKLANAQYRLGLCHQKGVGTTVSQFAAFRSFEDAANQNHGEAQYRLGLCYEEGKGVGQSDAKAIELYKKAIAHEEPVPGAHLQLGAFYENGTGGLEKNLKLAIQHFTEAVNGFSDNSNVRDLSIRANLHQGICCFRASQALPAGDKNKKKLEDKAFEAFQKAARANNPEAQFHLGYCYENGLGVTRNYKEALHLYLKATNAGYAKAQLRAGYCYVDPKKRFTDENLGQAAYWYNKAAQQDHYVKGQDSLLAGAAHDGLAWVYDKMQRRSEAKDMKKEAKKRRQGRDKI